MLDWRDEFYVDDYLILRVNFPYDVARHADPAAENPGIGRVSPEMREVALVTDDDLARARVDPQFRHRLVADNLELLLNQLNRLRSGKPDAQRIKQIREGVDLAVQLAEILQRIEQSPARRAS